MEPQTESSTPVAEQATDYDCFVKAKKNGEPTFTLRGQDRSSAEVIQAWIDINIIVLGPDHPKIRQAHVRKAEMVAWPLQRQAD